MIRHLMIGSVSAFVLAACGSEAPEAEADPVAEAPAEAAAAEATSPETVMASPPMWVIEDEDSRMVLFPTIHILTPETEWYSDMVRAEVEGADEVWFEILPSEQQDQAKAQQLSVKYGVSAENPLSQRLDEETYADFEAAAAELGLAAAQLDPLRPWLAALSLTVTDLVQSGFNPQSGVEYALAATVPSEKHRALETLEEQLQFLSGFSEEVEIDFLKQAIEEVGNSGEQLSTLVDAWAAGDVETLDELLIGEIRAQSEDLYQVLLVQRNNNWIDPLVAELEGSGTDFVAVGGGHLIGEDGVPALLEARGYSVQRLN